ncbi:MAG TPA: tetratricopeptide repeat protein [Anaerolineales bacterium]|nr:tetratricopeptide repeat protein [Anaerolineales bacterium]
MTRRKSILLLLSVLILVLSSQVYGAYFNSPKDLPDSEDIDGSTLANVPPVEVAIAAFQERLKQNPQDPITYTLLANQYIRQARETGDVSGYQRAEDALNQALDLLPTYSSARTTLASVYYSQHEFMKALELAQEEYDRNPKDTQALVIAADSQLSLGNYQEAESMYRHLSDLSTTPPMLARLAAVEELKGDPDQALILMRRAAGNALKSGGTKESVAWYILRVADMYFSIGKYKQAGGYYEAALRVFDNYHLALAGLGKVSAAQGDYDEAIAYYQQAINLIPQPDYLAALGDLYTLTRQPEQAQVQYQTVEYIGKLAALNRQVYNRQLANFYSDHNMKPKEALRLALAELKSRQDIYGYDAAAWAEYRNGNLQQAQTYMEQALALGTQDARLYYHAGLIAHALHQDQQAREYLETALSINPHFSILDAEHARASLEALRATANQ